MKKIKIILGVIVITFLNYSFISFNKSEPCDKTIVATWISEDDPSSKMIFTTDFKCYMYYENVLSQTFRYKISNTSPQCGEVVAVGDCVTYLNLTSSGTDGYSMCYEINGITDVGLSITPIGRYEPLVYKKQ